MLKGNCGADERQFAWSEIWKTCPIDESESSNSWAYHLNAERMTTVHKWVGEIQGVNTLEEK